MELKHIRQKLIGNNDERAVSPVIGVILMVAITVILAAVIAAFVLDIGDLDDSAPNAQFDWESDDVNSEVTISHQSGDNIDLNDISVSIEGNGTEGSGSSDFDTDTGDADFTAGDEITFEIDNSDGDVVIRGSDYVLEDDLDEIADGEDGAIEEVTITWEADGSSTIITDHET